MAINFPATPTQDEIFTVGNTTWQWNGTVWNIVGNTTPVSIPNSFNTVSVSGQSDVVADQSSDTITFIEGANITLTTDAASDSITISSTGGGGGGGEINQNAFSTVAVSGQNSIVADSQTDTLNIVAGTNITLTTDETTDSLTINSTAGGGSSTFNSLSDVTTAGINIAEIYEPAIAMLRVDNISTSAYTFNSHYSGNNPTIYALAGTTIAFDLSQITGHPFELQDPTLTALTTNLVHVSSTGTISTNSAAQGKDSGVLYWRIPESISGNYVYQCQSHGAMFGVISVKRLSVI